MLRVLLCAGFLCIACEPGSAQVRVPIGPFPGFRVDTLSAASRVTARLSAPAVPGTVHVLVDGIEAPSDRIAFDPPDTVRFLARLDSTSSVLVYYRAQPLTHFSRDAIPDLGKIPNPDSTSYFVPIEANQRADPPADDPFGNANLRRSGSISRGVIAGNRQDATIESGLRLQLAGEIVDGVSLRAVLSDENTPILPEGTTQRIDEFDKVFIELSSRRGVAQLGDFELTLNGSEFGRFGRKLQGVSVTASPFQSLADEGASVFLAGKATVAAATSRGKFRSQTLAVQDGAQGPYRLEGENGERFIILIPASEAVFMDGERLVRGETNDYVVDYSTAEITFSPNRLVSNEKRVVVEFEYTTNQFTRTLVASEVHSDFFTRRNGTSRASLNVAFIREADSRQFFDEFGLSGADSVAIAAAGDGLAIRSGAEIVEYDSEAQYVQYTLDIVDLADGSSDTVYVAVAGAISDTTTVYRVRFSPVGQGNGSYARVGRNLNGIAYEYVGKGAGEYDPVRLLPIPREQRLFDIATRVEILPGIELHGEFAQSANDSNRLSALDSADDVGTAGTGGIRIQPVEVATIGGESVRMSASYERRRRQSAFRTFNRTRAVEFGRDWNLGARAVSSTGGIEGAGAERIDSAELKFGLAGQGAVTLNFGDLGLGDAFDARRWSGKIVRSRPADSTAASLTYLVESISSSDHAINESGKWFRQNGLIRSPRIAGWIVPQFGFQQERREQRSLVADSLTGESLAFVDLRPGVALRGSRSSVFGELQFRNEDEAVAGVLTDASTSLTAQSRLLVRSAASFRTNATVGYRVRKYSDVLSATFGKTDQESLVLSWNGDWRPLRRAVATTWLYEAQTERTPRLQEIYVRTGPEFGEYVWIDDNGDGVLQIEEFVQETTPNEGVYSRTFVPSDSLFSAVSVQARLRVDIDPSRIFRDRNTTIASVLNNIATGTLVEVSEKSRDPQLENIYLLRQQYFRGPNTLNGRLLFRQSISLFKSSRILGVDGSFTRSRGLSDLSASAEERINEIRTAEARVRLSSQFTGQFTLTSDRKYVFSEALSTRQFDLRSSGFAPALTWVPGVFGSIRLAAEYTRKADRLSDRKATLIKLPVDVRFQKARRFQVSTRLELASVSVDGAAAGLAGFELTDGRGAGRSYLWNLTGEYFINQYLRASVTYDGRNPAAAPVLHTVRMQLSASF